MSVGDRWWNPNPAPAPADTGAASGKPTVQDLGNGYSLVQFTDENGLAKSQIVPNKDAASVAAVEAAKIGAGAAGVSASISANAANQRAAVQAEIDRAKNASDAAHNAAVLALQQGNSDEARRQFDISSQELARSHQADEQLRQQSQHLEASKFGNDVYNKLAELASNPRNYMEQFFRFRGQPAPANSAQYGNTSVTGPGLMTLEQFLPNFLRSTGLSQGAAAPSSAASTPAPSAAAPTTPQAFAPNGSGVMPALQNPTALGGGMFRTGTGEKVAAGGSAALLSPQQTALRDELGRASASPTTLQQNAGLAGDTHGGMGMGGGTGSGQTFERNIDPQDVRGYAHGGSLRMTAPHAIVNLLSGKVAAIAGEQPGRGPQGFVPETAKFNGKAIIAPNTDPSKIGQPGDPIQSFYPPDPTPTPNYNTAPLPSATTEAPAQPLQSAPMTMETPKISPAEQQRLITESGAGAHPAETPAPVTPEVRTPDTGVPAALAPVAPAIPPVVPPLTPAPVDQTPTVPTPTPAMAPPATETPAPTPAPLPSFLTQTPSGIGKNPAFLPEDTGDPIVQQMLQEGTFAPFLQRIFAQQAGLAGLGTNVPQQTNLPAGVPLVSQLALNQMSPSEFAGFQSFLSAHGVDWNDYIAMVREASPTGSVTQNAYPKFLGQ